MIPLADSAPPDTGLGVADVVLLAVLALLIGLVVVTAVRLARRLRRKAGEAAPGLSSTPGGPASG